MTYEGIIDEEEEARVDIDFRRFSLDHHYQVESNEWLRYYEEIISLVDTTLPIGFCLCGVIFVNCLIWNFLAIISIWVVISLIRPLFYSNFSSTLNLTDASKTWPRIPTGTYPVDPEPECPHAATHPESEPEQQQPTATTPGRQPYPIPEVEPTSVL